MFCPEVCEVALFDGRENIGGPGKFVQIDESKSGKRKYHHGQWIEPGTTIVSDCWKGYMNLSKHGYIHKTVNHSVEFTYKQDRLLIVPTMHEKKYIFG